MSTQSRHVPLLDLAAQHAPIREEILAELIPLISGRFSRCTFTVDVLTWTPCLNWD
ncbi:MAG: hypothetical protein NTW74_02775 [Acidobacteria bacterium]|nr:hypothetical protein [Acidobacteriota bacterium]